MMTPQQQKRVTLVIAILVGFSLVVSMIVPFLTR